LDGLSSCQRDCLIGKEWCAGVASSQSHCMLYINDSKNIDARFLPTKWVTTDQNSYTGDVNMVDTSVAQTDCYFPTEGKFIFFSFN
jgi:hypothetical protein